MVIIGHIIATIVITISSLLFVGSRDTFEVHQKPDSQIVKAIYLTAYTAGNKIRRSELIDLINKTELNAVVIDLKDYSGRIFFDTRLKLASDIKSTEVRIPDLRQWLLELHEQDIYTIGRIVVFQDPYLAKQRPDIALQSVDGGVWRDHKGLAWVDPTQLLVWKYNLDLAEEAAELGFDEINFDYVRFPSDGNIRKIAFANLDENGGKNSVMNRFYRYVDFRMRFLPVYTSADLFGMVLWRSDGLNIGQRLQDAAQNFDYVAPMVYPSHYPPGFEGFSNPAEHPYEIVYRSLVRAGDGLKSGRAELRPWIQDFDLGADYTSAMIRQEIQASYDVGAKSWYVWNAANRYTAAAFLVE